MRATSKLAGPVGRAAPELQPGIDVAYDGAGALMSRQRWRSTPPGDYLYLTGMDLKLDWTQRYAHKVCTAAEAIHTIQRGRRILIGSGAAEPTVLVDAMVVAGEHLADNEIVHLMTEGPAPYVRPGLEGRFRHTAFFIGENVRDAIHEGRADFMPVFLSDIPRLIVERRVRIDVALIQVSPPDAHGFVSLGVSVDIVRAAVDSAGLVLAEVNPRMPRTHGDSFLHVDRIAHLVPVDYALPERIPEPLDAIDEAIGKHVATLVPDGATLQTGIGRISHAVLAALRDRSDLGVHTEMLSDGVMDLVQRGVITGRAKTLLPQKIVTSFLLGSRELYAWAHDNPALEMRSSAFTNDPFTIARHDRMIALNSALAVDLTGQVASDTLSGKFFSGIGGQVDFIRGAARSRGGKPIIALRSTAKRGTVSRIRPALEEGAGVVTSRGDVRYVVTEHGIADLWGRNIRERALALVEIAHPDHRAALLDAAKQRRYVFPDQVVPRAVSPISEAHLARLRSGEALLLRPVRLSDEGALQDLLYHLSDESIYRRFLGFKRAHPHEEMQRLVNLDDELSMGIVACAREEDRETILAMARYDVDPKDNLGDFAVVVRDEAQRKGVGTALLRRLIEIAKARGVAGFKADVLMENKAMMSVFQRSGLQLVVTPEGTGVYHVVARFAPPGKP
ncbi:bifunctional acetyl-CoA hydrolase/transferase family protein/GNAT family N-acetyltransferase [Chondromyces apiculatus]|uniref:4-hydroxybutyrate coenzyme A transferase n=1 Tax=Chondromyces apiculatus DSM 436 TaxID=1192034 RepID=A0A017T715_9BACT|nr:bifunctional acetyl-CoA hydrolase/transferase family protein/GNAT family N-acetyltransferase [Chondromyces apiculatus]EYF04565.1 4-hydroxybutyrate coenzyme A transferase [Chondromyces apiculatus DSM 436]